MLDSELKKSAHALLLRSYHSRALPTNIPRFFSYFGPWDLQSAVLGSPRIPKWSPRVPKWSPSVPKWSPNGPQGSPIGPKGSPNGPQRSPKAQNPSQHTLHTSILDATDPNAPILQPLWFQIPPHPSPQTSKFLNGARRQRRQPLNNFEELCTICVHARLKAHNSARIQSFSMKLVVSCAKFRCATRRHDPEKQPKTTKADENNQKKSENELVCHGAELVYTVPWG